MSLLLGLLLTLLVLPCFAQDTISSQRDWLMKQQALFPQEKIHVMTDRELYHPGDILWMRIWVQDGLTLQDSKVGSKFVTVELRDGRDQIAQIVKIREVEGRFAGQMVLPKSLNSGDLTLIAYTQYMLNADESFLFKKEIHFIKATDWAKGYRPRPLYEEKPTATPIEPLDEHPVNPLFRDTLTRITIEVPAQTWYAVSVTDDALCSVDPQQDIVTRLTNTENIFNLNTPHEPDKYYIPSYPVETSAVVRGKLKDRRIQDSKVFFVNNTTNDILMTFPEEDGTFKFEDVDLPEKSLFTVFATDNHKNKYKELILEPIDVELPLTHLQSRKRNYYVNINREDIKPKSTNVDRYDPEQIWLQQTLQKIVSDSLQQNFQINTSQKKNLDYFIEEIFNTSNDYDLYARLADHSYFWEDFSGISTGSLRDMLRKMHNITFKYGFPMYKANGKEATKIRFILGNKEQPYEWNEHGEFMPEKILNYPLFLISSIDVLSPEKAAKLSDQFMSVESTPAIIRVSLIKDQYSIAAFGSTYVHWACPIGYQKKQLFKNTIISHNLTFTRYWNPEVYSSSSGTLTLDLPLPSNHSTTYTIRIEGVTPEGTPISIRRRLKL